MDTLQFKTNIKCSGCIAKATPFLNEVAGKDNWMVDVQDPNKVLTIATSTDIDERVLMAAIENAGYTAERI